MAKSTVFIGSSKEGLDFARAVRSLLSDDAEVSMWNEGFFKPGRTFIDTLVKSLSRFDFAILVLTPDDLVTSREVESLSPRDNLLFESGLFMGRLGPSRTFVLHQANAELKIPSDLAGLTMATYEWPREDNNHLSALGPACDDIRNVIRDLGAAPERSGTQVEKMRGDVKKQKDELEKQQEVINQLVIFSMSQPIFEKLRALYYCKRDGGEYIYRDEHEEATRREFFFLRDNGYLASTTGGYFDPGQNLIDQDIVPLVELTPIGNFYVEQREELERKLQAANNG